MGCSHCMDDARADSEKHMTIEMVKKAVDFKFKDDRAISFTSD